MRLRRIHQRGARAERGIALLESLVAILIVALGIFGILGVQLRTLTDTQTAVRRAQAIRLIENLSERLRVNPNALTELDAYVSAFDSVPAPGDCESMVCSQSLLIAYDLGVWKQDVQDTLPLGQANIFLAPAESMGVSGNRRQLGVMIGWRENERSIVDSSDSAIYKKNIDATQVRSASGALTAGGGAVACPEGLTCHLQYIAVPARCAPYLAGGTTRFFCPGA